jgi:hypothetical protein
MTDKPKIHPLQRAWAAGVFDARCTVPQAGATLRFESVDEAMIKRFHSTVGVGQLGIDEKKRTVVPVWIFRTTNLEDSRELILLVAPFLSPQKLAQTSEMLARIERNPTWQKKNPNKKKLTLSETAPAPSAEEVPEPLNTVADGDTASPATRTGP